MRVIWERGPRTPRVAVDNGRSRPVTGKKGGPIFTQEVVKRLVPRSS